MEKYFYHKRGLNGREVLGGIASIPFILVFGVIEGTYLLATYVREKISPAEKLNLNSYEKFIPKPRYDLPKDRDVKEGSELMKII